MKQWSILCVFFVCYSGHLFAQEGIRFVENNLKNALKQAKEQNKAVFIDFTATWCRPCKRMAGEVFGVPAVAEYFNQKFICVQVDVDKEKKIAKQYKITNVPTFVVLDAKGKEIGRRSGFTEANRFLHFARVLMNEAPSFEDLWEECVKKDADIKSLQIFLLEAPVFMRDLHGDKVEIKKWQIRVQKILANYISRKPREEMVNIRDLMIIFTYCMEAPRKENEMVEFVVDSLQGFLKIAPHRLLTQQLTRYEINLINQLAIAGDRDYLKEIDRVHGDMKVLFDSLRTGGRSIESVLRSNAEAIYVLYAEKDQAKYLELKRDYLDALGSNATSDDYYSAVINLMKATGITMSPEATRQCLLWLDRLLTFKLDVNRQATYVATMGDCFAHLKNKIKAKECYNQAYLLSMQTKNVQLQMQLQKRINALEMD